MLTNTIKLPERINVLFSENRLYVASEDKKMWVLWCSSTACFVINPANRPCMRKQLPQYTGICPFSMLRPLVYCFYCLVACAGGGMDVSSPCRPCLLPRVLHPVDDHCIAPASSIGIGLLYMGTLFKASSDNTLRRPVPLLFVPLCVY